MSIRLSVVALILVVVGIAMTEETLGCCPCCVCGDSKSCKKFDITQRECLDNAALYMNCCLKRQVSAASVLGTCSNR
uniref:Uncharacterized protein n=1 Tax=Plectus sambesii TaxID=2011161 RepID=A0A914WJJ8_9BILA